MDQNPKLKGSQIVDCIPHTGECPMKCGKEFGEECFYNGGRFYRTLEEPLFPSMREAVGKIVRVNSGHDSNIRRECVIESTARYPRKFYNTSIPKFDFPSPVVFTCNGRGLILAEPKPNLMFVRIRTSMWNVDDVDKAVDFYLLKHGIPIILTFMRYYRQDAIHENHKGFYIHEKHILNEYWVLNEEGHLRILERYKGEGVRMCGTPVPLFAWIAAIANCCIGNACGKNNQGC